MTAGVVPVPTVFEDDSLPHQVRTRVVPETEFLTVTCTCLIKPDGSFTPLVEPKETLDPTEILAAQARHELEAATS